ncbi:hypothetical protein [uncultured Hoeflea sp.]|uniref:hypothetical protein n=1 Tax=uncultured Hoeflea sp. TaxID=538666 RepID=UPI002621A4D1|nr:hypothetical protein [uncultured Hoeflea sp.]
MALSPLKSLAAAAIALGLAAAPAASQESITESLSERVLFVTSGGYWEEIAEPEEPAETAGAASADNGEDGGQTSAEDGSDSPADAAAAEDAPVLVRGYYRLIAIRGQDNRSQLELQQITLTPEGPQLAMSIGVEEINALGADITDIRPENSTGRSSGPGFAAFIYLKTAPEVVEPETWALFIDEFGDIVVEPSSN